MRHLQTLRARPEIARAEFPGLVPVLLRPDPIPTRGEDAIGVQRILDRIVQLHQRMVVPAVRLSNLVRQEQMGSVLSKALCGSVCDHSAHAPVCVCLGHWISPVVDHVDDEVHFAQADAAGRERIEFALLVPFLGNLIATSATALASDGGTTYVEQLHCIFTSRS